MSQTIIANVDITQIKGRSRTGDGDRLATAAGTYTASHAVVIDTSGNLIDTGAPPAGGSVTSVALIAPVEFSVGGSPISTSGTLTLAKNVEPPNQVWASGTSTTSIVPVFRALVPGDLPIATTSGLGAVEPDGTTITISTSGVVSAVAASTHTSRVFGYSYPGTLANSQELLQQASMGVVFASNWVPSFGTASHVPAGVSTFTLYKNFGSVGSVVVGTTGVFSFTSTASVGLVSGDVLSIKGPSTADTSLADVCISLVGTRT